MTTNTQMQRFLGGVEQGFKDVVHATGGYTAAIYDALTIIDTTTGTIGSITLPATVPVGTAREHAFLDKGGQADVNPITILAPGGGSINGAASVVINEPFGGVVLITTDGLNYTTPVSTIGSSAIVAGTPQQLAVGDINRWVDTSGGNVTLRVPLVMFPGWRCRIQKYTTDANTILIARNGFGGKIQKVAGDYTWTLSGAATFPWIDLTFDGTDIWVQ